MFRNIHILPHFHQFSQWIRCAIFQINTNLLIIQRNINIFTQDTLYLSFISKKIGAFHCKRFPKHIPFTTFSLFLKVSEVCNTSSKCGLPNNSANKVLLHTKPYTSPLFKRKNLHSPLQNLLETSTFSTCRLVFTVDEVCNISNKNRPPSNIPKH